jgi:hypothetical protein
VATTEIDQQFRAIDANNEFKTVDTFYDKAYDLMKSAVAKKLDIVKEPETIRNTTGERPSDRAACWRGGWWKTACASSP